MKGLVNYNYYTALLFDERPDLHMTVQYYRNLAPRKLGQLIVNVNDMLTDHDLRQFRISLSKEDMFGPRRTVRVLRPEGDGPTYMKGWPQWLLGLGTSVWSPHVTCKDRTLVLTPNALAIMTKKKEIVRWNLLPVRKG